MCSIYNLSIPDINCKYNCKSKNICNRYIENNTVIINNYIYYFNKYYFILFNKIINLFMSINICN